MKDKNPIELTSRIEYIEVPLDDLIKSFSSLIKSDDNMRLDYIESFVDANKQKVIFKMLVSPNLHELLTKTGDSNENKS